jgi:hypothetical protein
MKGKNLLLLMMTMATVTVSAQKISVKNEVIDCGQVLYRHPATAEFEITNKGGNDLIIDNVEADCGCSKVDYPKRSLARGDSFVLKGTYDAKQLGHFEKTLFVYSNGSKKPLELTIRGVVVTEIVDFSGSYPFTLGQLRVDKTDIEFDDVNRGERPYEEIHVMNPTKQAVQPTVMHLPNYLSAIVSPTQIAPGHSGVVRITLNSSVLRDLGLTQTSVYLGQFLGDKVSADKEITMSAVLLPDFRGINKTNKSLAPHIVLSTTQLDFGDFGGDESKKEAIEIQNKGKSTLDIRSVQMFTTGIELSLNKRKLEPGEEAKLKIKVMAKDMKNLRTKPRVLMITNDPDNPKVVIQINVK